MKVYAAIDPGKSGGIVALFVKDDKIIKVDTHVMPMLNKDEYDLQKLGDIVKNLSRYDCHFVIENVHSIYGASAKSNFQFGLGVGFVRAFVAAFQIPYTLIQSKAWQKVCFVGVKVIEKTGKVEIGRGKVDTKAMAIVAAKRIFPKVNLVQPRCKIPHSGIVDAILMSWYNKLNFK